MPGDYLVGSYYFPNYHIDPRNEKVHGPGWTEWELVKQATPRWPGHAQPKIPARGYLDEADPTVMAATIDLAADHGVDYFIFDWYYYDDGPFLERCLEQGYLAAPNRDRVKFCCMWANHDWTNIHPVGRSMPRQLLYPGRISERTWGDICELLVTRYFMDPAHFTIDGAPYFSIYDLTQLLASFGGVEGAGAALARLESRAMQAGLPGVHLNAVVWGRTILPGERQPADPLDLVRRLGFHSTTSYVWIHHVGLDRRETPYEQVRDKYFEHWEKMLATAGLPYFPNVTMGWDSSPRTIQSDVWAPVGYPFTNTIGGNTPAAFKEALALTKARLDAGGGPKILNLNCWNEWTEGSYLEPDTITGLAYLEALREVFGPVGDAP